MVQFHHRPSSVFALRNMEREHFIEEPTDTYQRLTSAFVVETEQFSTEDERHTARKAIETMNTPLYASVAAFESASEDVAHKVHTRVRNEGMYILFLDRAYERKDDPSRQQADAQHQLILGDLPSSQQQQLLALENKLFAFWDIEQDMRERMRSSSPVSEEELREFILRKSTDIFLYATITRFSIPMPREVMLEFYVHQLLRDVDDDFRDLAEDAEEQMPNPLLLKLWQKGAYDFSRSCDQRELESLVTETGVFAQHTSFIRAYCQAISANLPEKYKWMRQCAGIPVEL
jgi:hypothetical protein